MSENDPRKIKPEIVQEDESEAPRSTGLRRIEGGALDRPATVGSFLENLLRSPEREERQARKWAAAVRAHEELREARAALIRSGEKFKDLPLIVATDHENRQKDFLRAQNEKVEEERKAFTAALDDEIAQKKKLLELTEIEAKLAGAKSTPKPKTEDEKVKADFDRHFGKESAIRAEAQRRIEEVLKRAGGNITPEVAREIENINDYAQRKIDEL